MVAQHAQVAVTEPELSTPTAMTRSQMVERIQSLNPTASAEYLSTFSPRHLLTYLEHLTASLEPRGRLARWLRPEDSPALSRWVPGERE